MLGSPGSHRDVFPVICVMEHKFGPSEGSSLMKTHSSTKAFVERIFDQDPEGFPFTSST